MEEKFKTISLREEDEKKQIDSNYYLPSPKKKRKENDYTRFFSYIN